MSAEPFPIRPLSVWVENFRGIGKRRELGLGQDLTVLVGRNAAGKSSLLVAIEWCLHGATATKKSGSGIAERGDWSLAHHGALAAVQVSLELEVAGGRARLTRTRALDATARDADELRLELPGGELLEGGEVDDWLAWNQMPDWKRWKRSFCQHQEQSRARVTESADRSSAIAGMLGLGEYRQLTDELKKPRAERLEKCAARELGALADAQGRALERPSLELRDLEAKLERLGSAAAGAGEHELEERRSDLVSNARALLDALELEARVPGEESSTREVLDWAEHWPRHVSERIEELRKQSIALATREQTLAAALDSLGPARRQLEDARGARRRLATELGTQQDLQAQGAELARQLADLERQRRLEDARGQLLRDALEVVKSAPDARHCPVCEEESEDLAARIERELTSHAPDALRERLEELAARRRRLGEQDEQLTRAQRAEESAQRQLSALEENLRGQLPAGAGEGADLEELSRSWHAEAARLAALVERGERHLEGQRRSRELLAAHADLREARARANTRAGELCEAPEFQELQRTIDEAAGFASDLAALGSLARALEDEQSARQVTAINESIDDYLTAITADAHHGRVRIAVKKTATKVNYQLVDENRRPITSRLNQAAFNALSLAVLFAAAESNARRGRPQFLVLDDPGQSLDAEHQAGLARALARVASFAPVIVASFPGELAEALARVDVESQRTYLLTRDEDGTNTRVEELQA